jgi:polysaccharide export outer membrane protein
MIDHHMKQAIRIMMAVMLTVSAIVEDLPAATTPNAAQESAAPAQMVAAPVPIAAGDLLDISVFDVPELAQQVRVGANGKAQLALLGNIELAGLTSQDASEVIARELRDRHLLLHPQVNVLIKEFASKGVSVTGEVQRPGVYPVLGPRTLLDVISLAGGLTNFADTNNVVVKRRSGSQESITAKLNNGNAQSSLSNDVQVFPGDLVLVPRAGIVYVLGNVNRPGGYLMQDNGKLTVLQALAQAGGASPSAASNRAVLLRKSEQGGYITTKLQTTRMARGEDSDLELRANDIVFMPSSHVKNVMRATQSLVHSLGGAAIYAGAP